MNKRRDPVAVASLLVCFLCLAGPPSAAFGAPETGQAPAGKMTTVIVLRHADRDQGTPDLNAAGQARAAELVHFAGRSGIKALYWSGVPRSWQTVKPLADCLGIAQPAPYGADYEALAKEILSRWEGSAALVVGHSDTVKPIVEALAGPGSAAAVGTGFDDVTIVTVDGAGNAAVLTLRYGAALGPVECRK